MEAGCIVAALLSFLLILSENFNQCFAREIRHANATLKNSDVLDWKGFVTTPPCEELDSCSSDHNMDCYLCARNRVTYLQAQDQSGPNCRIPNMDDPFDYADTLCMIILHTDFDDIYPLDEEQFWVTFGLDKIDEKGAINQSCWTAGVSISLEEDNRRLEFYQRPCDDRYHTAYVCVHGSEPIEWRNSSSIESV